MTGSLFLFLFCTSSCSFLPGFLWQSERFALRFYSGSLQEETMITYPQLDQRIDLSKNFRLEHTCSTLPSLSRYHYHDSCEVCLFLRGDATLYVETSACRLKRGDLFVFSPGELHRIQPDSQSRSVQERCTIHLRESFLHTLSSSQTDLGLCFLGRVPGQQNYRHLDESEITNFLNYFEQIRHFHSDDVYGADLRFLSAFTEFLIRLNQLFLKRTDTFASSMPGLIRDIMEFLNARLTEEIQLTDLSASLRHNGAYLSRRFKEETGITIRQYLIYKRIILAKELLRQGCPLTEACIRSGFHDYSNFSRTFTRQTGCSPGHFQKHGAPI